MQSGSRGGSFSEQIYDVVEGVLNNLASGSMSVERRVQEGGNEIEILPKHPSAAKIQVRVEGDWVYFALGMGTLLEIGPNGQQYTERSVLEELEAIVNAVVSGRFRETIWTRGDVLLKARGVIELPEQVIRSNYGLLWNLNPFRRTEKTHIKYEAY